MTRAPQIMRSIHDHPTFEAPKSKEVKKGKWAKPKVDALPILSDDLQEYVPSEAKHELNYIKENLPKILNQKSSHFKPGEVSHYKNKHIFTSVDSIPEIIVKNKFLIPVSAGMAITPSSGIVGGVAYAFSIFMLISGGLKAEQMLDMRQGKANRGPCSNMHNDSAFLMDKAMRLVESRLGRGIKAFTPLDADIWESCLDTHFYNKLDFGLRRVVVPHISHSLLFLAQTSDGKAHLVSLHESQNNGTTGSRQGKIFTSPKSYLYDILIIEIQENQDILPTQRALENWDDEYTEVKKTTLEMWSKN